MTDRLPSPQHSKLVLPAAVGLAAIVGVAYALIVPHGLPYDEPSYWATTQWYGDHHNIPVLGHPGVTYEAQHPPVAFVLLAIGRGVAKWFGATDNTAIVVARLVGGMQMLLTLVVLDRILRRLLTSSAARFAGLGLFGATPMFVAMAWSVSNDITSVMLGILVIELVLAEHAGQEAPGRVSRSMLAGVVAGLALLAKITVWPLIATVIAWLLWRYRTTISRGFRNAAAFFVGTIVTSAWWFAWNIATYHRLVGEPAAEGGPSFGDPSGLGIGALRDIIRSVLTYLWLPTEYFRNMIHAPTTVEVTVVLMTLLIVASALWGVKPIRQRTRRIWRGRPEVAPQLPSGDVTPVWALVIGVGAASTIAWAATYAIIQPIAPRTAYVALSFWAASAGFAIDRGLWSRSVTTQWVAATTLTACLAALNVWTLHAVAALGPEASAFLYS